MNARVNTPTTIPNPSNIDNAVLDLSTSTASIFSTGIATLDLSDVVLLIFFILQRLMYHLPGSNHHR